MIAAAGFYACGPSAEDVLKKYESHGEVDATANKAGIEIESAAFGNLVIKYSNPLLSANKELTDRLSPRWFVVDAENPALKLPAKTGLERHSTSINGELLSVTDKYIINLDSVKAKFLLVGFEGISQTESAEAATPLLFFIVEKKKDKITPLTPVPRLAGELFTAGYEPIFFSEQEYAGEIPFEKSKNVNLSFRCSADLNQVANLKFSAEKLHLAGSDYYSHFSGSFESIRPSEITNSKIIMEGIPLTCDLTVTNACLYGTVQIIMPAGETKSLYVVFKNITTPQEIPENILNGSN